MTRDAFGERLMPESLIASYVARTAVPSFVGTSPGLEPPLTWIDEASPWEQRMVEHDLFKTGRDELAGAKLDALILDLIDERFEVLVGQGIVTGSMAVLKTAAWGELSQSGRLVTLVSPERFDLWDAALPAFLDWLRQLDVPVLVHEAQFASHYRRAADGVVLPLDYEGDFIETVNDRLSGMYRDVVEGLGNRAQRIVPPRDLILADSEHRWGLAPFHYVPEYYDWFVWRAESCLAEALQG